MRILKITLLVAVVATLAGFAIVAVTLAYPPRTALLMGIAISAASIAVGRSSVN